MKPTAILLIRSIFILALFTLLSGCGDLSSTVQLNFPTPESNLLVKGRSDMSFVPAGGSKKQGAFTLRGGIGNQVTDGVKSQGRYKVYGGIHAQGFAK